jgi:hypothetical protein
MSDFALDHVVMGSPDPDGLLARISQASGLAILRGWTPAGEVQTQGVRFANGLFLDVSGENTPPPPMLGLAGPVGEAEAEAVRRGWRVKVRINIAPPPRYEPPPWSILMFRKGQGALSALFVIDYARDHPSWRAKEFSGELFQPEQARPGSARLARVWIAADDSMDAELAALGLAAAGEVEGGRLFRGRPADVVLCDPVGDRASVVRLDIEGAIEPGVLEAAPGLTFRFS